MKRVLTFVFAGILFLLSAGMTAGAAADEAEFTPYDYHIMYTVNGKYVVYDFPDIMLYIPIEWEDAVTVVETDEGTAFYQTASFGEYQEDDIQSGGFLFQLCASGDESFRELPAYEELGYSENAKLHFYLRLPSDYPAWPDETVKAEYDKMSGQIEEIVKKAKISKSMHFYTDDIVSTDAGKS